MNRFLAIVAFFVMVLTGCASKPAPEENVAAGGRLEVAAPTFDNGVTARGDTIKHVFELKNVGDTPVKILDVKASCSCTAAVVSDPVIQPGAAGSVEVSFNTRGRKGQQAKTVKVFTDSALSPWLALTVSGEVKPAVAFSDEMVQLGQVPRGTVVEKEVELVGLKAEGVQLGELKLAPADDPRFTAVVVEGSGGRRLKVSFKSEGKNSYFRGRIDVVTSSAEYPSIFLTVVAEVTGDIVATPRTAVFPPRGRMTEAEKATQQIKVGLKSLSGKAFQVKGLKDDGGPVKLAAVNPVEGGGMELTLEGPIDATQSEGVLVFIIKEGEPFEMNYVIGRSAPAGNEPQFKGERVGPPPTIKPRQPAFKPGGADSIRRNPRMFDLRNRAKPAPVPAKPVTAN